MHRWARLLEEDRDLENPGTTAEWTTVCRDCGTERGASVGLAVGFCVAAAAASVVCFWLISPFLGAVLMIGAVGGLMWTMLPASIGRVVRWLSAGRWN